MSGFGSNPTTGTQGALSTNQFPLSSVAEPGRANGDLTALEGGPGTVDSNSNRTAPASVYVKDGGDVAQGTTTDAAVTGDNSGTLSAKLRGLTKILTDIWDSTNHLFHQNVKQVGGTAVDTNSGNKSAGTQRIVIATDQPALTNAQPANVTQFGGNNVATGTGAGGSGVPRMTVSNDSQVQLWDGTNGPTAVKAANTLPTLTDKSLVHSLSPNNSGLPVNLPVIVQSTNNKSSGSVASLAKAFVGNNVQGNSIIVVCGVGNGTAPTISDSAGNTYTQAAQINNSTALNVAVFCAVNIASGANTVTVNNGGSTASIAMEIYEVSGLLAQVPAQPNKTATNTGSSGTASTTAVSVNTPNQYAFVGVGVGTAAQTITSGSGWTNDSGQQNPTTPAGLFSFVSMSQFLGGTKAVTPQATFTSEPWAIAVATFKPVVLGVEGTVKLTDGTTTMAFGSQTSANSVPVVIASDQGAVSVSITNANANGQATMANSSPVVIASNQGAVAIGVVSGTVLAADQTNTILKTSLYVKKSANADTVLAVGSATSANSVPVVVASDQGAIPASQSGTWTVQPGNTANTTAWLTQDVAGTSGGSTPYHLITASGNNATNVKNAAGLLYGYTISNTNASARFLKLYDSSSAPTAGSGTPKHIVQIPGSATVARVFPKGLVFASGIGFTTTTGIADTDTGSVGTDISLDLDYK